MMSPRASTAKEGQQNQTRGAADGVYDREMDDMVVRTWLEDGDEVVLSGFCQSEEVAEVISFGECRGIVLPSVVR